MAKYFTISHGLRGCYMSDSCYEIRVDTRRELKAVIEDEARDYRDAGFVGANKRAIAWLATQVWREAHKSNPSYLPHALPLAPSHACGNYCYGIFASTSTRADWKAHMQENSGEY